MPKIAYIDKNFRAATLATIATANEIIEEYTAQGYDLTLRQLYYQMVARGYIENSARSYKNFGNTIDDGRLAGLIDWDRIVDRTRNLRKNGHFASPEAIMQAAVNSYRIDKWADQPFRCEVWIEKDALVGVIDGVCSDLDVPYFACRGYNSQSEMWTAARRLLRWRDRGQTPVILAAAVILSLAGAAAGDNRLVAESWRQPAWPLLPVRSLGEGLGKAAGPGQLSPRLDRVESFLDSRS